MFVCRFCVGVEGRGGRGGALLFPVPPPSHSLSLLSPLSALLSPLSALLLLRARKREALQRVEEETPPQRSALSQGREREMKPGGELGGVSVPLRSLSLSFSLSLSVRLPDSPPHFYSPFPFSFPFSSLLFSSLTRHHWIRSLFAFLFPFLQLLSLSFFLFSFSFCCGGGCCCCCCCLRSYWSVHSCFPHTHRLSLSLSLCSSHIVFCWMGTRSLRFIFSSPPSHPSPPFSSSRLVIKAFSSRGKLRDEAHCSGSEEREERERETGSSDARCLRLRVTVVGMDR